MQKASLAVLLLATLVVSCDYRQELSAPADDAPRAGMAAEKEPKEGKDGTDPIVAADPAPVALMRGEGLQSASVSDELIGVAGGSVRLGDYEIVVPPGAVTKPTRFSIRVLPEAAGEKHAWAEFSPHNVNFAVPVVLRLPHSTTDAEPDAPAAWWSGDAWIAQPTTPTLDGRIQILVDHFSVYATMRRGITMIGG